MVHIDIRDGWWHNQRELASLSHVLWAVRGVKGEGSVHPLEVSIWLGLVHNDSNLLIHPLDDALRVNLLGPAINDVDGALDILEGKLLILIAGGLRVMLT
jgi:hypothetical protein